MVTVVQLSPERAVHFYVGCPHLAHGQGMGCGLNLCSSGGGLFLGLRSQGIAFQVARVFAFINEALMATRW